MNQGIQDPSYVKPAPSEFPKMVYRAGSEPRIVKDQVEQDALGKGWLVTPEAIHAHLDKVAKAQYVGQDQGEEKDEEQDEKKAKKAR